MQPTPEELQQLDGSLNALESIAVSFIDNMGGVLDGNFRQLQAAVDVYVRKLKAAGTRRLNKAEKVADTITGKMLSAAGEQQANLTIMANAMNARTASMQSPAVTQAAAVMTGEVNPSYAYSGTAPTIDTSAGCANVPDQLKTLCLEQAAAQQSSIPSVMPAAPQLAGYSNAVSVTQTQPGQLTQAPNCPNQHFTVSSGCDSCSYGVICQDQTNPIVDNADDFTEWMQGKWAGAIQPAELNSFGPYPLQNGPVPATGGMLLGEIIWDDRCGCRHILHPWQQVQTPCYDINDPTCGPCNPNSPNYNPRDPRCYTRCNPCDPTCVNYNPSDPACITPCTNPCSPNCPNYNPADPSCIPDCNDPCNPQCPNYDPNNPVCCPPRCRQQAAACCFESDYDRPGPFVFSGQTDRWRARYLAFVGMPEPSSFANPQAMISYRESRERPDPSFVPRQLTYNYT